MLLSGKTDPHNLYSIPESLYNRVKIFFTKYTASFRKDGDDIYNEHVQLKITHTLNVHREISELGTTLGMNAAQLSFVRVIALLHDIGRFEQFDQYNTFSDGESENHSEIALEVFKREGLLNELQPQLTKVIFGAILNHNRPVVSESEPAGIDFYSRLLRDADKLDIWRIAMEINIFHRIQTESFPATYEIPDRLMCCFENNRIITLDLVESFYDSVLFRLSWIFDLNFACTLKTVRIRNIPDKLAGKLPESDKLKKVNMLVNKYIETHIKDG